MFPKKAFGCAFLRQGLENRVPRSAVPTLLGTVASHSAQFNINWKIHTEARHGNIECTGWTLKRISRKQTLQGCWVLLLAKLFEWHT